MRVLYICTGNSFRSPTAEALTRKFHPGLEVESAGTHREPHIAGNARQMLEEENALEYLKPSPDQLSQRAVEEADKTVCMMPGHKEFLLENFEVEEERIEVWNIEDPINTGKPRIAFGEIKGRVRALDNI